MPDALEQALARFRGAVGAARASCLRFAKGQVFLALGDAGRAAAAFRAAAVEGGDNVLWLKALYGFGLACARSGRPGEAEEAFREILARNDTLLSPFVGLAAALLAQERAEEALAVCRGAVARHPAHPELAAVFADGARALDLLGRWREGEAWCLAGIREHGLAEPVLRLNLATFRFRLGDRAGAREALRDARAADPAFSSRAAAIWADFGDGEPL